MRISLKKPLKNVFAVCFAFLILQVCAATASYAQNSKTNAAQISPAKSTSDAAHFGFYPAYPQVNYGSGKQAELIKKGEYLVKAGDCIACHTDTSPAGDHLPFAGGLKFNTPFGAFYSPNITSDKKTGLGTWTEADFVKSMQHGVSKDGSYNFPVFPFLYFTKVTKDDLHAIYAYMTRIPAVSKESKAPGAPFPFSWRPSLLGWRILFFNAHQSEYQYDTKQTKEWNRGAYLVNGLGHCGMCHTPLNFLGAPKWKYFLTGTFIDDYWAPNISATGLAGASVDESLLVFSHDKLINNAGTVAGPMAEVNHNSLNKLTTEDLRAIVVYLKTVNSQEALAVHPISDPSQALSLKRGKQVYDQSCVICHSEGVLGAPVIGNRENWTQRAQKGTTILYRNAIEGYNQMPYKGGCVTCTDADIKAGVDYLLSRSIGAIPASHQITTKPLAARRSGKQVYQASCAICHDSGHAGAKRLGDKAAWAPVMKQNFDVTLGALIKGKGAMPSKGSCVECSSADLIAATKYILDQSRDPSSHRNFSLW